MTDATPIDLDPGRLTLAQCRSAIAGPVRLTLTGSAWRAVAASAATVERIAVEGRTVYGVNTGFGRLAQTRIDRADLGRLQRNLVLSHAAGIGPDLTDATVRLMLLLKINALARGHSGIRPETLESLIALLNADILPCVPAQGSVGASGDLAPLAHMAAVLLGVGRCRQHGEELDAANALERVGRHPADLAAKEGLALLNGTQTATALALHGMVAIENTFAAALVAGAMSVDAVKGSDAPFDDRLHALRGHSGQRDVAAILRHLLEGSAIRQSHLDCGRVQDPYSLRCQPQVMGACLDAIRHAAGLLAIEANAVSDNPIVFPDTDEVISGGNFHAEPVGFAADHLALAAAEIGALSERRIALLTDTAQSGLPAFLTDDPGLNSGFMIAHVTAAALASENKQAAHPSVTDSLPTSANQEDHVSMATHGARRLLTLADNTAGIVGIELLAAAQGIDFHRPMKSSVLLEQHHGRIRASVPRLEEDRTMAPDIEAAQQLVERGAFSSPAVDLLPSAAI
ncbi:histidine ammonia-lyase [Fodinicurvata sp. EGI_FJ10296]|uniref:histidine ammonia-lyase n=1 Tax=Fodinicurvata sp. EGI_FJ10296 TaxID=3231908 RepID=UPI003453C7B7